MSRLTFTKEYLEHEGLGKLNYVRPEILNEWDDKLRRYEDLGEPEELVKVVRCEKCVNHGEVTADCPIEDAWEYVKSELWESGVPCSNQGCPACTPLKDGIRTIDSFISELIGLGHEEAQP